MNCFYPFLLLVFTIKIAAAQQFSPGRVTAWQNAGLTEDIQAPSNQVLITDFGADNQGLTNSDNAYALAVQSLGGQAGTIVFPTGEYLFNSTMVVPDSVFLKGESADTKLEFDLGGSGHLIQMTGSTSSTHYQLSEAAIKGTYEITLENASEFEVGDIVRLGMFDEDLMFSSWAYGTLGQIVEITAINEGTLTVADPLNHHYPLSRNPYVRKQNPIRAAGVECLSIVRDDETTAQTNNILIQDAYNCVVRNVAGEKCNYGHVDIRSSSHILVEGCYFHHAHGYGGGGKGYGVVLQATSSFCLTRNNIFEHLRHSMIIQSAANGNVFGYNYSYDPFWEDGFLPANSAGDAVLHGNYTYLNLFEGNTIQHMVIDASHGKNGPYNTFFRNRAELYGFFSDASTVTDSMNVVGNEITNSGFPYGLFMLNGLGHYSYGNNHSGAVTPTGTQSVTVNTLYLNNADLPAYLNGQSLPVIGYPIAMNTNLLPAESRFGNEEYVGCNAEVVTEVETHTESNEKLVQLNDSELIIDASLLPATVNVYHTDGRLVGSYTTGNAVLPMKFANRGVFLIEVVGSHSQRASVKTSVGY